MRLTKQRKVIIQELHEMQCHPTVDELFNRVRKRLPRISLSTVYRNLDILSKRGLVKKLDISGGQSRYDANTCEHLHFRCLSCGRLEDVPGGKRIDLDEVRRNMEGYELVDYKLEFTGYCPECKKELDRRNGGRRN